MSRFFVMVLLVLSSSLSQGQSQPATYRFSPVNQWDINKTAAYWNPIVQYVSDKSGLKLELKIARTSAETTLNFVLAHEVEFVFTNHLFSPEREALGWRVFGRRNAPRVHGQLVVPANSPITRVEDLRGQEVSFAGAEAFVGYKVPYAYLLNKGIDIKPVFGGNQNAAFDQMFAGKTQACGSNSMLVEGYANRTKREFRVIWTSEGYHDLALMVSSAVPEKDAAAVAAAFLGMHTDPKGRAILRTVSQEVGLDEDAFFVPATNADYANYRKFYQTAPAALR